MYEISYTLPLLLRNDLVFFLGIPKIAPQMTLREPPMTIQKRPIVARDMDLGRFWPNDETQPRSFLLRYMIL